MEENEREGVSATHTNTHSPLLIYFFLILQSNPDLSLNNSHSSSSPTNTGVDSSSPVGFSATTTYSIIQIH